MNEELRQGPDAPEAPQKGADSAPTTGSIADGNLAQPMELDDFMEGLGTLFQLPRRKPGASAPLPPPRAAIRRKSSWIPFVMLGFVAVGAYFLLRVPSATDSLPPGAAGQWTATEPRYADRGFDLDSTTIVFHTGKGPADFTRHEIRGVRVRDTNGKRIVTVEYALADGSMTFAFWLQGGPAPVIRLVNQPEIAWTK